MLAMEERALALKAKKPELDDLKQALGIDRITVQVEELNSRPHSRAFGMMRKSRRKSLKRPVR